MKRYTISNDAGKTAQIVLGCHLQNIWHTSAAHVSRRVKARIERELGPGPYRNPCGHFGQAQVVNLW